MKNTLRTSLTRRLRQGFSLAEVTIATGITAVAMSTLLGLIPQGLQNIKEAGELSSHSRITRQIFGTLSQQSWKDSSGADALAYKNDRRRFFFNDQAGLIEEEDPDEGEIAYVAELLVPEEDVNLPAGPGVDPFLRRVTVRVANVPLRNFDFDQAPRLAYRSQSTVLARTGL